MPVFFSILFIISLVLTSGCSRTEKSEVRNNDGLSEIEIYAELDGITVEEELHRLEIQNAFAGLDTRLSIEEPETFAGLYIQSKPEFRIAVLFTRDGVETIKPYIPDGMEEFVEVRTVSVSYLELQNAQSEISSSIRSLGISTASDIDIYTNRVKIFVVDLKSVDEAIRNGILSVPEYVDFVKVESLMGEE
jgi:hypothetical protein